MHYSNFLTTVLVSVLFLLNWVAAAPVPQNAPGAPIARRWTPTNYNSTITNSTDYGHGHYTNRTVTPHSYYSNSTGNWTQGGHYNRTTSGSAAGHQAQNFTYPWMAKPSSSNSPIKPTSTPTFKPFEGSAVSVARFSGSWTIVVAVIGAMAML